MKIYLPAGAALGLILGLLVSRGFGILLLAVLGATLGWLLTLITSPES